MIVHPDIGWCEDCCKFKPNVYPYRLNTDAIYWASGLAVKYLCGRCHSALAGVIHVDLRDLPVRPVREGLPTEGRTP